MLWHKYSTIASTNVTHDLRYQILISQTNNASNCHHNPRARARRMWRNLRSFTRGRVMKGASFCHLQLLPASKLLLRSFKTVIHHCCLPVPKMVVSQGGNKFKLNVARQVQNFLPASTRESKSRKMSRKALLLEQRHSGKKSRSRSQRMRVRVLLRASGA